MDTVWLRLTNTKLISKNEYFMFGPTGVVRFHKTGETTVLLNSAKTIVAEVEESPDYIMITLAKIRGTSNRLETPKAKKKKKS